MTQHSALSTQHSAFKGTQHSERLGEILESPECFCGQPKKMQQPFCYRCFYALPLSARQFVKRIRNDTFRGTYEAAINWLKDHIYANQSQT